MNKVYESDTCVIHDDRDVLSVSEAINMLWAGQSIQICYPPDFSAENECDIYDSGCVININDIITAETCNQISQEEGTQIIESYLRGYELYK